MVKKINIWDVLAWVSLVVIIIWVVLKITGVINTPLWLEYVPVYCAVYIAGWQIHKLHSVAEDVKGLKNFKDATIKEISSLKEVNNPTGITLRSVK